MPARSTGLIAVLTTLAASCAPGSSTDTVPCETTTDCPANYVCRSHGCRLVCRDDFDCPTKQVCALGVCATCGRHSDCAFCQACNDGRCIEDSGDQRGDCNGHGRCQAGACACNPGYLGETCNACDLAASYFGYPTCVLDPPSGAATCVADTASGECLASVDSVCLGCGGIENRVVCCAQPDYPQCATAACCCRDLECGDPRCAVVLPAGD